MDKVLFVDDDLNLLKASQRKFRKAFEIDIAQGGKNGLAALEEKGPYAVIVSDLMMPGMNGFEFLDKARARAPESALIMLTGHAALDVSIRALNEGEIYKFLTKPCKMHVLEQAIRSGIEHFQKKRRIAQALQPGKTGRYRNKILIVDDDPEVLSVFSEALNATDDFDVLTAECGSAATSLITLMNIDMVIADNDMPDGDGASLLASIRKIDPDILRFLMSWLPAGELRRRTERLEIDGYFEKPLDMASLAATVRELLRSEPKGRVDGISTSAFLQMIELEEKTCMLTIRSRDRAGRLFFQKGHLIAAEAGDLRDEDAAYEIINWRDTAIEIQHTDRKAAPRINLPLMHILMEAARILDETAPDVP